VGNTQIAADFETLFAGREAYRIPLQEGAFDFLLYVGAMMVIYTHD